MYKVSGKRARRIIRGFVFDIDIEEKFEWRIILKCTYYYTAANKSDLSGFVSFYHAKTIYFTAFIKHIWSLVILFYNWIMEYHKI